MRAKWLMCGIFLSMSFISKSQLLPTWVHPLGTSVNASVNNDGVQASVMDASGNIYYTGYFSGSADFDGGSGTTTLTSLGAYDIFIMKKDANGTLLWAKSIGSTGNDVAFDISIDPVNNIHITGYFSATVDFNPDAGIANLTSAGGTDVYVLKLNSSGVYQYAARWGGTTADQGYGIEVDNFGNVYTVGTFTGTIDIDPTSGVQNITSSSGQDIFVSRLSSSASFLFGGSLAGGVSNDAAYSIDLDGSNNMYITGRYSGNIDLDPTSGSTIVTVAGSGTDAFIIKLSIGGSLLWHAETNSVTNDEGLYIHVDGTNVFVAGKYEGATDFDPTSGISYLSNIGNYDSFLWKLNTSGVFQFAKNFSGGGIEAATTITTDASGNIYVAGNFTGVTDFDPSNSIQFNLTQSTTDALYIVKLDNTGLFQWVKTISGSGNNYATHLLTDASSNLYLSGNFMATADFDPSSGILNQTAADDRDGFTAKFAPCSVPSTPGVITGNTIVCNGTSNNYSIASVSGATSYIWTIPNGWTGASASNSISATAGTYGGNISVNAENSCGSSLSSSVSITVNNVPMGLFPIDGDATICEGSTEIYSTVQLSTATSYTWTLPVGWSGTSTSDSITIIAGTTGGTISLIGNNSCGSSSPVTLNVTVDAMPTVFGNDVTICEGDHAELEASSSLGNVNWYDENTNGNLLLTGPIYITGNLYSDTTFYITGDNNGCETNPRFAINVIVNPMPDATVTVNGIAISSNQNSATLYQWLDCNNSFGMVSGETSQTYLPSQNGTYAVSVNLNGCVDTSICTSINTVGWNELNYTNEISFFPNPANDFIQIELKEPSVIRIINISGQILQEIAVSNLNFILDVSLLPDGVYILEMASPSFNSINKIIIQH